MWGGVSWWIWEDKEGIVVLFVLRDLKGWMKGFEGKVHESLDNVVSNKNQG